MVAIYLREEGKKEKPSPTSLCDTISANGAFKSVQMGRKARHICKAARKSPRTAIRRRAHRLKFKYTTTIHSTHPFHSIEILPHFLVHEKTGLLQLSKFPPEEVWPLRRPLSSFNLRRAFHKEEHAATPAINGIWEYFIFIQECLQGSRFRVKVK